MLPDRCVPLAAVAFGTVWFQVVRCRRSVILDNLAQAFPDKTTRERLALGQANCVHLIRTLLEFFRISQYARSGFDQIVRFEGMEHYEGAKKKGKGVLVVSGHLGSFELVVAAAARRLRSVSVIVKRFPHTADRFINAIRLSADLQVIPARGAIKHVLQALKTNGAVVVVLDQNSTRRKGVFVNFFGKPACTMVGPAVLAVRTGAPVIGASVWRERTGLHVIRFHPEFPFERKGSRDETLQHLTQLYTCFVEQAIRDHPEQWLWPHKRWRTQRY